MWDHTVTPMSMSKTNTENGIVKCIFSIEVLTTLDKHPLQIKEYNYIDKNRNISTSLNICVKYGIHSLSNIIPHSYIYTISEGIQNSLWNKSSIGLDYIELRIQLNQFEIFLLSFIHEKHWQLYLL